MSVVELNKENFLVVLKGAPLSVLMAVWVHGSADRGELIERTGWKKSSVDKALRLLGGLELIERIHYRRWGLASGFKQLPLPLLGFGGEKLSTEEETAVGAESPPNGFSEKLTVELSTGKSEKKTAVGAESPPDGLSGIVHGAESLPNGLSEKGRKAESLPNGLSGSEDGAESPPNGLSEQKIRHSDQKEEEEERGSVDKLVPVHFEQSCHLLESIGLGGDGLQQMAVDFRPHEVLGAWWFILAGGWARSPKAVLRKHLLSKKTTPYGYLDLAGWWLSHADQHGELVTAVCEGGHIAGLSAAGVEAAVGLYERRGEFGL